MNHLSIKNHVLGNLRIYLPPAHKIRHGDRTLFRKLFPRSAYVHIIREARKDGILNATAHSTHAGFAAGGKIAVRTAEGDNAQLAMVVELIDSRDRLEEFFLKHKELLRGKVIIYKEVEFWDAV